METSIPLDTLQQQLPKDLALLVVNYYVPQHVVVLINETPMLTLSVIGLSIPVSTMKTKDEEQAQPDLWVIARVPHHADDHVDHHADDKQVVASCAALITSLPPPCSFWD